MQLLAALCQSKHTTTFDVVSCSAQKSMCSACLLACHLAGAAAATFRSFVYVSSVAMRTHTRVQHKLRFERTVDKKQQRQLATLQQQYQRKQQSNNAARCLPFLAPTSCLFFFFSFFIFLFVFRYHAPTLQRACETCAGCGRAFLSFWQ